MRSNSKHRDSSSSSENEDAIAAELFDAHVLEDEELIALGSFLQNWLRLENTIDHIFGIIFNLDPYKRLCITSNMSISAKISALKAAANLVENDYQRTANHGLNTALNQAKKLSILRNDLSHNWVSGQIKFGEERLLTKISARGKLKRDFELIDFKQVKKSASKCKSVADLLSKSASTYAIGYDRSELQDISMLKSTKYDPEFLDESFHQIVKGEAVIKADG